MLHQGPHFERWVQHIELCVPALLCRNQREVHSPGLLHSQHLR